MTNKVLLIGHVGKDPLITSDSFARFNMITKSNYKDKNGEWKESTEWHSVVIFDRRLIPIVRDEIKAGTEVLVIGKLRYGSYTNKEGHEVKTLDIQVESELRVLAKKQRSEELEFSL